MTKYNPSRVSTLCDSNFRINEKNEVKLDILIQTYQIGKYSMGERFITVNQTSVICNNRLR